MLLPPTNKSTPATNLVTGIAAALATRFSVPIAITKAYLKDAQVEQWGKIRRVDSDAGDTMRASSMGSTRDDSRDASYVRVCMILYSLCID